MNNKQTLLALTVLLIPQAARPINVSQAPFLLGAAATAGVALYLAHSAYTAQYSEKVTMPTDKPHTDKPSVKEASEPKAKEPESKEVQRERAIKEAEQLIYANHYSNDLELIASKGTLDNPSTFTEQALHAIVVQLIKSDNSYYYAPEAINNIQKTLTNLNNVKAKLKPHIPFIAVEPTNEVDTAQEAEPSEVDTVTPLIDVLDGKIAVLNKLCAFFRAHAAYMNLVQRESFVYKAYRSIIKIIDQRELDVEHSTKIIQFLAADYLNNTHPYLDAHENLKGAIKSLYIKLDATDKTLYPQQTQSAQALLDKLEAIEGLLVTSNEITNDRARRDDQRVVKEKQDLERAWKQKEFNLIEKQQQLERDWQRKAETMYEKAQRETQKIAQEKQELEKELKEKELNLMQKQQQLERDWQRKAETLYEKAQREAQEIAKEKQALEKALKEKELRLIEKQQKLERECQQKSEQHAQQITKEYRVVKAALEALSARMDAVEKGHQSQVAQ